MPFSQLISVASIIRTKKKVTMVLKDSFMPVDFVISLEGEKFASCGSNINMDNTYLSSDGRIVRLPYSLEESFIPDEFAMQAMKNTCRFGLVEFMTTEIKEIFSSFTDNITDLDFLIDSVKFMFFAVTFCIVSIHVIIILFSML